MCDATRKNDAILQAGGCRLRLQIAFLRPAADQEHPQIRVPWQHSPRRLKQQIQTFVPIEGASKTDHGGVNEPKRMT